MNTNTVNISITDAIINTQITKNIRNWDIVWLENKYKTSVNENMETKQMCPYNSSVLKYLFSSSATVTGIIEAIAG